MKLIILGPPGAGKGTQAQHICNSYNIHHVSVGDMLRDEVGKQTEKGKLIDSYIKKGNLIPDKMITEIMKEKLSSDSCKNGYLLDGFPRTLIQGEELAKFQDIDAVFNINVDDEILAERLTGRRVCLKCKEVDHITKNKEEICKKCGEKLSIRDDDKDADIILNRIQIYHQLTEPLINFYTNKGVLHNVYSGLGASIEVYNQIKEILDGNSKK